MASSHGRQRVLWWWRARQQQNPLLRPASALERTVASLLLMLVCAAAVGTAVAAGGAHAAANRAAQRDAVHSHPVVATVLDPSSQTEPPVTTPPTPFGLSTRLSWFFDGQVHTGSQIVSGDLAVGSTTTVWTDDSGQLVEPPLRGSDITLIVAGIALGGALLTMALALGAQRGYQAWAVHRRARLWAGDWASVSPLWSRLHGSF